MYGIDIFFKFRYALLSKRIYKIRNSFSAPGIATIIFSKDRAIQLCALLETFFLNKKGDCKVVVIYKASTNKHKFAYDELVNIYGGNVDFISETEHGGFKASLKVAIGCISLGKIFFLVDDIVFTEPVDFDLLSQIDLRNHIFSLRMGRNLSYSYVVSSEQELPREIKRSDNFIEWAWVDGDLDWGYPLSVDGHIFFTSEVALWAKYLNFNSPNSFETTLQQLKFVYKSKHGLAYQKSRLFNVPANRVQIEIDNLHGTMHQDTLLEKWYLGFKINSSCFHKMVNYSVHQDVKFDLIER